jgi:MOSC domain-containing protein YiiM
VPATVVAVHLNTGSRAPLVRAGRANAVAGEGLEGDRHRGQRPSRSVLVVEQEALDAFGLAPGDVREQVTVRGLDLMGLPKGARLRVGGTVLEVGGVCAPCERMNELQPGLRKAIDGRRGRFVRVVTSGALAVGDAIAVEPPAEPRGS